MTIKTIMFHLWYFKHTKMQFKKCPLTWVVHLIVFLPQCYVNYIKNIYTKSTSRYSSLQT